MTKNKLPSLTIFMGSFLIFGVQPMLGRTLLPAFGGTAAVWTTCLATYQVLLLVGYWYAHFVSGSRREEGGGKSWKTAHVLFLALAVAWVAGFAYGRPWLMAHVGNGAYPALEVLLCVLAFAGLPYVLLSANSTLIQAWVSRREERMRECGNAGMKMGGMFTGFTRSAMRGRCWGSCVIPFWSSRISH